MRILVTDRTTYHLSSRTITDEGFLAAPARVARTGIQQYLAYELNLTDRNPNEIINVYRPADEVFKPESLNSYQHKEVTNDHPPEMVSAKNYRDISMGQVVSRGVQDGEYVQIDLLVKDQGAIDSVMLGKTELSAGYYADYIAEKGTADGENYEFVQRNIVINHVALVDKARAGNGASIFDHKGGRMAILTLDKKRTVEVSDTAAPLIEDHILRLTETADEAVQKLAAKDAEAEKMQAALDGLTEENGKLKKLATDAAINARVAETLKVHDAAKKLHPEIEIGDKSIDDVKREVCIALHPGRDWEAKKKDYVNAVFDADVEKIEEEDEEEEAEKKAAEDSIHSLGKDLSGQNQNIVTDAAAIRKAQIGDAWKGE